MRYVQAFLRLSIAMIGPTLAVYCQPRVSLPAVDQPLNGSMSGKVVDESGIPVQGAQIQFQHFQAVQGRGQQITSKNDGSFTIPQLPAGDYASCVTVPKSDFVDDCVWNLTFLPRIQPAVAATAAGGKATPAKLITDVPHGSAKITVSSESATLAQQLSVRKGARIVIQFLDPSKQLDKQTHLIVGALSPNGIMIPAEPATGSVLAFEVVIPFDTPVNVYIGSVDVLVTGPSGTVNLQKGYLLPFKIAKTDKTPITTTFTVLGRKGK